jgi:hypothetical protein
MVSWWETYLTSKNLYPNNVVLIIAKAVQKYSRMLLFFKIKHKKKGKQQHLLQNILKKYRKKVVWLMFNSP